MSLSTGMQESSFNLVLSLFESLRSTIADGKWSDLKQLIELLQEVTKSSLELSSEGEPMLHLALRVMKIAREESLKVHLGANADFEENTTNRLFASGDTTYENVCKESVIDAILSAIDELIIDIKSCSESISDLSLNFIHSDEIILTFGFFRQVYRFLKRASEKKRTFKVIICEGYPKNMGYKLAEDLSKDGISVILIPDTHCFAMMSRVNKVIIGCDAVYPDGTLKAPVGTYNVLQAAKHYSTPTYVCLPQYKISPVSCKTGFRSVPPFSILPTANPSNSSLNWLNSPVKILPPHDPIILSSELSQRTSIFGPIVWNPCWELIPAGFVSLFLTNLGSHAPSYLYALGRELFHHLDVQTATSW